MEYRDKCIVELSRIQDKLNNCTLEDPELVDTILGAIVEARVMIHLYDKYANDVDSDPHMVEFCIEDLEVAVNYLEADQTAAALLMAKEIVSSFLDRVQSTKLLETALKILQPTGK